MYRAGVKHFEKSLDCRVSSQVVLIRLLKKTSNIVTRKFAEKNLKDPIDVVDVSISFLRVIYFLTLETSTIAVLLLVLFREELRAD